MSRLTDFVEHCFAPKGGLSKVLPRYVPSEAQYQYALAVARTLAAGRTAPSLAVLEADTGTGKTLGYCIPLLGWAALKRQRVAISSASVQLQLQLLEPGGPVAIASRLVTQRLGPLLSVQGRFGQAQFVSPTKALEALNQARKDDRRRERRLCGLFEDWLKHPGEHLLAEWLTQADRLPLGLRPSDVVFCPSDPKETREHYLQHCDRARQADVVVVNHAVVVLSIFNPATLSTPERALGAMVLDEADRLAPMIDSLSQRALAFSTIGGILDDIQTLPRPDSKAKKLIHDVRQVLASCEETVSQLRPAGRNAQSLRPSADAAEQQALHDTVSRLAHGLNDFVAVLARSPSLSDQIGDERVSTIGNSAAFLEQFNDALANRPNAFGTRAAPMLTWSRQVGASGLRLHTQDAARLFGRLFQVTPSRVPLKAAVLTSATLGDGSEQSLRLLPHRLGVFSDEQARVVSARRFEVSQFGSASFVLAGNTVPSPFLRDGDNCSTNPAWLDAVAQMISEACAPGHRVLVLCVTHNDSLELAQRLGALKDRLLVHEAGDRLSPLLSTYQGRNNAVLISASAWEGVDLPGLVPELVITRLPYLPRDTGRALTVRENMQKKGLDPDSASRVAFALDLADARWRFRQGLGRAIRHATDRARIWICDPRFPKPTEPDPHGFVRALPARFRTDGTVRSAYRQSAIWGEEEMTDRIVTNPWR